MNWRALALFILVTLSPATTYAEDYTTGYMLDVLSSKTIYHSDGNWYKVTNSSATKKYFIPTRTLTEGNAMAAHMPTDITFAPTYAPSCLAIMTYQKVTTSGNQTIDPDGPGGNAPVTTYCDMTTDGGGWTLVFNQNIAGGYFIASEALAKNTSTPTADLYSILGTLEGFRKGGIFTLKINWPGNANRNIWSQTTNPTVDQPVAGYTAINIQSSSNLWGGLERNSAYGTSSSYMDGSISSSNWYYAIASYAVWGSPGGIPAATDVSANSVPQVQLWVK